MIPGSPLRNDLLTLRTELTAKIRAGLQNDVGEVRTGLCPTEWCARRKVEANPTGAQVAYAGLRPSRRR